MSVETRLREALERSAEGFVPRAAGDVGAVVRTARRRRAGRRLAAGAAVVLALGAGASVVVSQQSGSATPPVVPAVSTSAAPSRAAAGQVASDRRVAADLMGTWTTGVVSPRAASSAMVGTGTAAYHDQVLHVLPLPGTITLTFEELAYRAELDGQPVDEGTWSVRDGKLDLVPYCTTSCHIVLGPTLSGGVLTLDLLEDSSPDVDRVPSAAFATVIYGAAPFQRR